MRRHIRGFDHAVIAVRDLDHARDTYERLGFKLTPRGYHTLGSQNHCIMFGIDYLELLALPRPHPSQRYYADFLSHGEGLAALALASDDAAAAHGEFRESGIAAEAPMDFSRPVRLAAGSRDAAFRIVQLPSALTPGCRTFVCQHFTPDLVWRPEYQDHRNAAQSIAGIAVIAGDPAIAVRGYEHLFATRAQKIDEGLRVHTGTAPVAITARWKLGRRLAGVGMPPRPRPLVAALFIRVADRARARAHLSRRGFEPIALPDGSCAVSAEQAHGITLVLG